MDIFYKLRPATSVKAKEREQTKTLPLPDVRSRALPRMRPDRPCDYRRRNLHPRKGADREENCCPSNKGVSYGNRQPTFYRADSRPPHSSNGNSLFHCLLCVGVRFRCYILCAERFWPEHVRAKAGKETQIDLQGREIGWDVAEKFVRQNDLDIHTAFCTSADVVSMQLLVDR